MPNFIVENEMTTRTVEDLWSLGQATRSAGRKAARLSSGVRNQVLNNLAGMLETEADEALQANAEDCSEARANGLSEAMVDRLLLTPERLQGVAAKQRAEDIARIRGLRSGKIEKTLGYHYGQEVVHRNNLALL